MYSVYLHRKDDLRTMLKRIAVFLMVCVLMLSYLPVFAVESDNEQNTVDTQYDTDAVTSEAEETTQAADSSEQAEEAEESEGVQEAADDGRYVSAKNAGTSYSCVYDSKENKIRISGSVTHDIFIKHRDYLVKLYKIAPGESLDDVLGNVESTPLAVTEISIKFNFSADVKSVSDIFSQYVVVLVSSEGVIDYIGPMLYPSVVSECEFEEDKALYKGVVINGSDTVYQSEPSTAIIPIYLDRLISAGAVGYLHSLGGNNVFFDRQYIDEIDKTVRNLSDSGAKIYFQLLLNTSSNTVLNTASEPSGVMYDIPDIYSAEVMTEVYTYCDFLSKRYSSYKNGTIGGMIIGKNLDDVDVYNRDIYGNEEDYTRALALYGIIVANAVRNNIPSADIAYSFTNVNTYEKGKDGADYASSRMIESISRCFEEYYSDDFDFSVVIQSTHLPLSITNEMLVDGIDLSVINDGVYIVERNTDVFVDFLNSLNKKYESAPEGFMYVWSVPEDLSGNALACAYSYLYYKFFSIDSMSALAVDFENHPDALYDILNIVKYIDTEKGSEITAQLLQFFKEYTWSDVVYDFDLYEYDTRKHEIFYDVSSGTEAKGEFYYFDFDIASDVSSWFAGKGCSDVSISYNSMFDRALSAQFSADRLAPTDYAYLFCSYEYPENFVYTPRLAFLLSIEGEEKRSDIFEVKISFHNGRNVYEYSHVVQSSKEREIIVDLSEFSKEFMAESMRISVRPMSEASGSYTLNISSITGKSDDYSSEELYEKISAERLLIRNSADSLDTDNKEMNIVIIVMAIVVALIIGVMLFVFLKREE